MLIEERGFCVNALFSLQEKLSRNKRYRESWAAAVVKRLIPLQIRVLRKEREWSQADLAKESKLTQGSISRAEDPDYGNLSINTLVRIAAGFDCAFVGRFVPFSELAKWYAKLETESALAVSSFSEDRGFEDPSATPLLRNITSVASCQLSYLAPAQTTEMSIYSTRQVLKKEPRTAFATTPRHELFMTMTTVQCDTSGFTEVS